MSTTPIDYEALAAQNGAVNSSPAPNGGPGEVTNDVGATVIVPKEGESFQDTLARGVARAKNKPQEVQADIDKETTAKNLTKKTAQALGGAAAAGVAGPAALAVPGEIADAIPAVLPHTIEGVKAIGTWAAKNPVQAYILYNIVKEMIPGAKKAMGVIKETPD